jgi:hypothetical protein
LPGLTRQSIEEKRRAKARLFHDGIRQVSQKDQGDKVDDFIARLLGGVQPVNCHLHYNVS